MSIFKLEKQYTKEEIIELEQQLDEKYHEYGIKAHTKRCDITKRKKYIVFIFNLLGIPLPKDDEKSKTK